MSVTLRRREDSGAVALLVAVLVTVLFGLAAIVVDLGMARDLRRQAQATADAAAVAAALSVQADLAAPGGTLATAAAAAVAKVQAYALANLGVPATDWAGCSDSSALPVTPDAATNSDTCISFSTSEVKVVLPARHSPVSFAAIYGQGAIAVGATARAAWAPRLPGDCILCVVGDATFDAASNGDARTDQGTVRIGGTVDIEPGSPNSGSLDVNHGDLYYNDLAPGSLPPQPLDTGYSLHAGETFADPYATSIGNPWDNPGFPAGPIAAVIDPSTHACSVGPSGVATLTAAQASGCTGFAPGLYVLYPGASGGNDVKLSAGGSGVLFFLTCANATDSAPLDCSDPTAGNGAHLRTPAGVPTISGIAATTNPLLADYRGFAIIIDPGNPLDQAIGHLNITGTVYAPTQNVLANDKLTIAGQLVVGGDLTVGTGSACTTQVCLSVTPPTIPLPAAASPRVRLVGS